MAWLDLAVVRGTLYLYDVQVSEAPRCQPFLKQRAGLTDGQMIKKGEEFIKLKVVSGDHLFVNRFIYNFQPPRRGDIIVFYSDHIPGLIEETHYIKRLIARGGERVRIGNDRHVYINGDRLDAKELLRWRS